MAIRWNDGRLVRWSDAQLRYAQDGVSGRFDRFVLGRLQSIEGSRAALINRHAEFCAGAYGVGACVQRQCFRDVAPYARQHAFCRGYHRWRHRHIRPIRCPRSAPYIRHVSPAPRHCFFVMCGQPLSALSIASSSSDCKTTVVYGAVSRSRTSPKCSEALRWASLLGASCACSV